MSTVVTSNITLDIDPSWYLSFDSYTTLPSVSLSIYFCKLICIFAYCTWILLLALVTSGIIISAWFGCFATMGIAVLIIQTAVVLFILFRVYVAGSIGIQFCLSLGSLDDYFMCYYFFSDSTVDTLAPSLNNYLFDITPYLPHLPVAYADEHESLSIIRQDTSFGGSVINSLLDGAISSNTTGLDLSLTPGALAETLKFIDFINAAPSDSPVVAFIKSQINEVHYDFYTSGPVKSGSWLTHSHKLPVMSKDISYCGNRSGVYIFNHTLTDNSYIGSALDHKSRNSQHYKNMTTDPKHSMHFWVMDNGGTNSMSWSPIMAGTNYAKTSDLKTLCIYLHRERLTY